jgi:hypothetical protein
MVSMNQSKTNRRQCLAILGAAGATGLAALGAGCAGLTPPPLRISRSQLEERLASQFPKEQRMLELLAVRMGVPSLDFQHANVGRLGLRLPLQVSERLSGLSLDGALGFSAVPLWDAVAHSVRLSEVSVSEASFSSFGGKSPAWLERLSGVLSERILNGLTVYQVPVERVDALRKLGWRPGALKVTPEGLEMSVVSMQAA